MRWLVLLLSLPILANAFAAPLAPETRGLKVTAIDPTSRERAEVKLYDKTFALLIGIDKYRNLPPDRQLNFAVRDAKGIEKVLRKNYRFDRVVTLYDQEATRERILDLLNEDLASQMGENDALFVFWAGHGNQEASRTGDIGYLIPHDGDPKRLRTNITMAEIRDTVSRKLPAKHVFYVMDACYSGLLTETRAIDKGTRRDLAYLKEITREPARQVLAAGSKGQEVLDGGPGGHSVFTGRLIELLENSGDFITANEIQVALKEKVYSDARARNHTQTPTYGTLYGTGDFVFVPSLEQKVADVQVEIAGLESELRQLREAEAEVKSAAAAAANEARRWEAEARRKSMEARLRAEQLKRQALVDEQRHREADEAERTRLLALRTQHEKTLGELKVAVAAQRKSAESADRRSLPTLVSAVSEIRRLYAQIDAVEARHHRELAQTREGIARLYDKKLAGLATAERDEFETEAVFRARQGKARSELLRERDDELGRLDAGHLADIETRPLHERIAEVGKLDYVLGIESIAAALGAYSVETRRFPVKLYGRTPPGEGMGALPPPARIELIASIQMRPEEARGFKEQWSGGLVLPEARVRANGELLEIALLNPERQSRWTYQDGIFVTREERQRREDELKRLAEENRREQQLRPAMLPVVGGCFEMGSSAGSADERPVHAVCLGEFQLSQTEVTRAQWRSVMGSLKDPERTCESCPIENVSWDEVQSYLSRLNRLTGGKYRLPSEAEWEYACLANANTVFCGSDDPDDVGWYVGDPGVKPDIRRTGNLSHLKPKKARQLGVLEPLGKPRTTRPVAGKEANAFGLYDMSGNASEWVADCWQDNFDGAPVDGRAWDIGGCDRRVLRGGSVASERGRVRASARSWLNPSNRDPTIGFRIARD